MQMFQALGWEGGNIGHSTWYTPCLCYPSRSMKLLLEAVSSAPWSSFPQLPSTTHPLKRDEGCLIAASSDLVSYFLKWHRFQILPPLLRGQVVLGKHAKLLWRLASVARSSHKNCCFALLLGLCGGGQPEKSLQMGGRGWHLQVGHIPGGVPPGANPLPRSPLPGMLLAM